MSVHHRLLPGVLLAALSVAANAAGIQATITTQVPSNNGDASGGFAFFLNSSPLSVVSGDTVALDVGDVLRAELTASATHESGTASSINPTVFIDFVVDPGVTMATVQTGLSGVAFSSPQQATGSIGSEVVCDFTTKPCSAPGLPLSTAFSSGALSSTLDIQDNQIIVNNVTTVTGNDGGTEVFDELLTTLELGPFAGQPSASVSAIAAAIAIFQATASGELALEVTVLDAQVVPVPAAAWLFVSALAGLGVLRRRAVSGS